MDTNIEPMDQYQITGVLLGVVRGLKIKVRFGEDRVCSGRVTKKTFDRCNPPSLIGVKFGRGHTLSRLPNGSGFYDWSCLPVSETSSLSVDRVDSY